MSKVILMRGLPGSGKSTFAKEYIIKNPNTIRTNKDELRNMLHNGVHSKGRESFVLAVRDFIVDKALADGHEVIIDDTNFNNIHEVRMREIAAKHNATVEIKDFTDVSIDVCIARDAQRPNAVGSNVIRTMYNQYLRPQPTKQECV